MNSQILSKINNFVKNRLIEFSGFSIVLFAFFLLLSIVSYSPSDPNFIYTPENVQIKNYGGFYGSVISDFLLQSIGLISFLIIFNLFYWGFKIVKEKKIHNFISRIFYITAYIIFGTTFVSIFYNDSFWLIDNGNGGFVGNIISKNIYTFTTLIENQYIVLCLLLLTAIFFILSLSIKIKEIIQIIFFPFFIIKKIISITKKNKENIANIDTENLDLDLKNYPDDLVKETQPILPFTTRKFRKLLIIILNYQQQIF